MEMGQRKLSTVIVTVLKHKCQRDVIIRWEKATVIMDGGFGPTLYTLQLNTWVTHIGKKDVHAIWTLLVSLQRHRGAVPKGVCITHLTDAEICAMKD
jgi:hypothetical protein